MSLLQYAQSPHPAPSFKEETMQQWRMQLCCRSRKFQFKDIYQIFRVIMNGFIQTDAAI